MEIVDKKDTFFADAPNSYDDPDNIPDIDAIEERRAEEAQAAKDKEEFTEAEAREIGDWAAGRDDVKFV